MNKMMCNAYEAKGILGYRKRKTYATAVKENKREETRSRQRDKKTLIEYKWVVKLEPKQQKKVMVVDASPGDGKEMKIKRTGGSQKTRRKTKQGKHKEKIRKINRN